MSSCISRMHAERYLYISQVVAFRSRSGRSKRMTTSEGRQRLCWIWRTELIIDCESYVWARTSNWQCWHAGWTPTQLSRHWQSLKLSINHSSPNVQPGMGSSRTGLDLEDISRTKFCDLWPWPRRRLPGDRRRSRPCCWWERTVGDCMLRSQKL